MIINKSKLSLKSYFSLSPIALCITIATSGMSISYAIAQEAENKGEEKSKSVEVITVTATRQTENLQDVAVSVTALSAGELQKQQINNLGDLESHIPNLNLHVGDAANAVVYIRGVGQIDSISFNDPGVGVYLDDVYMGRVQGSFLDVVDPEQIEVLRGPQGTLYGRNTIGGAVKFTSAKPTEDTQAYIDLTLGNYNEKGIKGSLSGTLVDDVLLGRVAFSSSQRDGYGSNLFDGKDDNDKDTFAWRGSLLYTPTDTFSAYLVFDGSKSDPSRSRTPHRETEIYSIVSGGMIATTDDPFDVDVNYNDLDTLDTSGIALTLDYDIGNITLKSITAYREMDYRTHLDLDGTTDSSFGIYNFENQDQTSQEFQLIYNSDNLSVVSGLYFFKENDLTFGGAIASDFFVPLDLDGDFITDTYSPYPIINAGKRELVNTSKAIYANVNYELTDKLGITVGVRYTHELKETINQGEEFFGTGITTAEQMEQVFGTGVGYGQTGFVAEKEWNSFSPKLGLDYHITDDVMLYASASRGFKSGGFNGRLTSVAQPFDPEEMWSYEAGVKSLLAEQSVRLNVATFYNDYKNFQLSRFSIDPDTGAFLSLFENAGQATIYGAELELTVVATDNLTINFNGGYLGGGYDELIGDFGQEVSDVSELVNAPKWNGRIGLDYFFDLGDLGELSLNVSASYRSKTYLTVSSSEVLAQPSYALIDFHLNYDGLEHWQVSLYGKNLTNEYYRQHGFDLSASPGVELGYYGAPRTFGINARYNF
jgi:iron complex outermembrane receptor protein